MAAALIQRRGPARVTARAGLRYPTRHRWETPKYDLTMAGRQAGDGVDDSTEKVSTLGGGWARIVWDLLRALRCAKLDPLERSLFDQAVEESWRPPALEGGGEAAPFRLDLAAVARVLECERKRLVPALRRLVAKRILLEIGDDQLVINKDYRDWKAIGGAPLLSPAQVAWARSIRTTPSVSTPRRHNRKRHDRVQTLAIEGAVGTPCRRLHPQSLAFNTPSEVSPQTPVGESGARRELIQELIAAAPHAREGLPDPDLFPIHDGPHSPTEPDAMETLRLARSLIPGHSIPEEIWQAQRIASPAVWRAAIREAARAQPSGVRMFRYVLAIASRFEAEGVPVIAMPAPDGASGQELPRLARQSTSDASIERQRAVIARRRSQAQEDANGQG